MFVFHNKHKDPSLSNMLINRYPQFPIRNDNNSIVFSFKLENGWNLKAKLHKMGQVNERFRNLISQDLICFFFSYCKWPKWYDALNAQAHIKVNGGSCDMVIHIMCWWAITNTSYSLDRWTQVTFLTDMYSALLSFSVCSKLNPTLRRCFVWRDRPHQG